MTHSTMRNFGGVPPKEEKRGFSIYQQIWTPKSDPIDENPIQGWGALQ
jgi:hypothetical protein